MASPPSPLAQLFAQLFSSPESVQNIRSALSSLPTQMATPPTVQTPTVADGAPTDQATGEQPSSSPMEVLNPEPLMVVEPTDVAEGGQETASEKEDATDTNVEGESEQAPEKSEKSLPDKKETPVRKRKRVGEKSKTKPSRRSHRIPRQARKSGPPPPVHVNLSDEEEASPQTPEKSKRGTKKNQTPHIVKDPSPSPEKEQHKEDEEEAPAEEMAETSLPQDVTGGQDIEMGEEEVMLSEILTSIKRAKIHQGKRPVEASEEAPAETPVISTSEDEAMLEGDKIDPKKAIYLRFYTEEARLQSKQWEKEGWTTTGERYIDEPSFDHFNLVQFLHSRGLYKSVSGREAYSLRTIREVYAHIRTSKFGDPFSVQFGKVYVKGVVYNLRPQDINEELGLEDTELILPDEVNMVELAQVLTGGKEQTWKNPMKTAKLTYLYSVLHKLMTYNWIVSRNNTVVTNTQAILLYQIGLARPFNLGQLIFHQMASLGTNKSNLSGFPFPSLIYRILKRQGFQESFTAKAKVEGVKSYTLNATLLFSGQKVKDLPWVDPSASSQPSDVPGVSLTVDSTVLENLMKKVQDMERVAQNVYNNTMGDLILLRTAIEDLLSSQKGGESSSAGAQGTEGTETDA